MTCGIGVPLPPVPHRTRRPPILAAIVAGAVAGGLAFAGAAVWAATHDEAHHTATAAPVDTSSGSATGSGRYGSISGWTSAEEDAVLTLIQSKALFDGYESGCVLRVLQDHFASLDDFTFAAETDSPELTSAAHDVILECGNASSRVA